MMARFFPFDVSAHRLITTRGHLLLALCLFLCLGVFEKAQAATLDIAGPAGAEILLDGHSLGLLPLAHPVVLDPGRYLLTCAMPGYTEYEQQVVLSDDQDHLIVTVRLLAMSRRTAVGSNLLLAGLGQHYLGHGTRGYVYNVTEIGALFAALAGGIRRSDYRKDYLLLRDQYNQAINADEIATLRAAADKAYSDMEDMESLRNTGLAVAGGVILLSMVDAWFSFPHFNAGAGTLPLATNYSHVSNQPALHAGLRLDF